MRDKTLSNRPPPQGGESEERTGTKGAYERYVQLTNGAGLDPAPEADFALFSSAAGRLAEKSDKELLEIVEDAMDNSKEERPSSEKTKTER